MTYGWYPQMAANTGASARAGAVVRNGQVHDVASRHRAWAARATDAILTAAVTLIWVGLIPMGVHSTGGAVLLAAAGYGAVLVIFGIMYGWMVSPGQVLWSVVSLRIWTGRRVGAWRGAWRFIGVGVCPLWLVLYLWVALTGGGSGADFGYSEPVEVVERRPRG